MTNEVREYDALVIGAGFGGLYMLKRLRDELGLSVQLLDKASSVGGTWHWNRYPGARSDTESFVYCYSFDRQLLQDWTWRERYLRQPEILSYLEHVVERYGLSPHIQLDTEVRAARFDADTGRWTVETGTGERFGCKYLVTAIGLLSSTNLPRFEGREKFRGKQYHTGAWPADAKLDGLRVGIIGTGSTGVQFITETAPIVRHLTVFQRRPQYTVPAQHRPMSPEETARIKAGYDGIWADARNSSVAFGFVESKVPAMSVSAEERERVFQQAWDHGGGFHFMFGTFCDIATDPQANEAAADFIRRKIAEIVEDPETARKLTPRDLYARRPLCDGGYYETFNRDNVTLVDVRENPIVRLTETGVVTADGQEHPLDVLVYATGFDGVDGAYRSIELQGRNGIRIADKWSEGATSYLGITNADFPNMFMILGPNGPFTNLPPSIETQVEMIADLVRATEERGARTVEATQQAESSWMKTCNDIAQMTLFPKNESWIFGANIPGKKHAVLFYMGGLAAYREQLSRIAANGWEGFRITV